MSDIRDGYKERTVLSIMCPHPLSVKSAEIRANPAPKIACCILLPFKMSIIAQTHIIPAEKFEPRRLCANQCTQLSREALLASQVAPL